MSHAGKATKAKYRERMIEVRIRFFTDELGGQEGYILPKHGWTSGFVSMDRNDSHGIEPGDPSPFNSLMEIPAVIERVLVKHNIVLHRLKRMSRYIE